ncbi:MAG TPA: flagellar type III secretion system pore protein FliP [Isosphaeraceae bacterium]|jgi:flagellar biosynthetic protein FliP|nr:flagellar type III secretion system pore protein FliP [Isosphaeraceae bacterium]
MNARRTAALCAAALAVSLLGADDPKPDPSPLKALATPEAVRAAGTVGLFALASLAPAAVLMVTAFVRIQIVLTLLRQALGSPQVPGNQALGALALLLTALVMQPVAARVHRDAVAPYQAGRLGPEAAWHAGTQPIKEFMVDQIYRTHHERYLADLYSLTVADPGATPDAPERSEDLPLRVVAPAFLISELTTALVIGFLIYIPFLVVDLVVAAVLAAMGLVMLPPALVSVPLKLILFVLAGGWWLVSSMLLRSFGMGAG